MTLGRQGRASPRLRIRRRRNRDPALECPRSRLLPRNARPQSAKCAARRLHVSDRSTRTGSAGVRKEKLLDWEGKSWAPAWPTPASRRSGWAPYRTCMSSSESGTAACERSGASPGIGSASLRPAEI